MRIVFFGCTKFSEDLLKSLFLKNHSIVGIFSIPKRYSVSYSDAKVKNTNFADISLIAKKTNIVHYEVDSVSGKKTADYSQEIMKLEPDVILVLGWYYMVPKSIRDIPKYGAWGIHASLLPKYAGGAPLVWSIIKGEKETGVTLFRIDSGVDDGDIIAQKKFPILEKDTIKEVYQKATIASINILDEVLSSPNIQFTPQDKTKIRIYPQRNPKDGLIDWSWDIKRIKNFIRAQTKPYPGAYTILNNKKVIIWDANIEELS